MQLSPCSAGTGYICLNGGYITNRRGAAPSLAFAVRDGCAAAQGVSYKLRDGLEVTLL